MVLVLSHPIHIARKKNVVSEGNLSRAKRETSGVNIRVLLLVYLSSNFVLNWGRFLWCSTSNPCLDLLALHCAAPGRLRHLSRPQGWWAVSVRTKLQVSLRDQLSWVWWSQLWIGTGRNSVTIIYELAAGSSATCSPDLAFSFGVCAIVPARHKILGRRSILDKLIVYYNHRNQAQAAVSGPYDWRDHSFVVRPFRSDPRKSRGNCGCWTDRRAGRVGGWLLAGWPRARRRCREYAHGTCICASVASETGEY
jgi:hypothetical protein